MGKDQTPVATLTAEQMEKLRAAAAPLWRVLDELGWADAFGGAEFERVFPETLNFIHAQANPLVVWS